MAASSASHSQATLPWAAVSAVPTIQLRSFHLAERMGRTLLLVPHYDDECAAGGLLQKLQDVTVLFLTDGAPRDPYFWRKYESREAYSGVRKRESVEALAASGIRSVFSLDDLPKTQAPADQELYKELPQTFAAVKALAHRLSPRAILAPAFEGGHPDHDAASFLAAQLARHLGVQHWELPYYHRTAAGQVKQQEFLQHLPSNAEVTLWLSDPEIKLKQAMWSRYQSQCAVLSEFAVEKEIYREAPKYAWNKAPHKGVLNYEAWGWNVKGADLTVAFESASTVIG